MAELKRIGLSITEEMDNQLEALTDELQSIKSEIIRAALREFLEKHGKVLNDRVVRGGGREGAGRKSAKE
jgi:metal-responsive CopG/Arc/MetJ family transcriptional regulator